MPNETSQVPATQTASSTPSPVSETQTGSTGQVAPGLPDRLTGAELAAVFTARRRDATALPAAEPQATSQEQPAAEPAEPETPGADEEPTAPDDGTEEVRTGAEEGETPEGTGRAEIEDEAGAELPKGVRELQERVNKLTARLRDAERQRDEAKAVPQTPQPSAPPPLNGVEYGHVPEIRELHEKITQLKDRQAAVEAWLEENPDGGTVHTEQGEREVSVREARRVRLDLGSELSDLTAQRAVLISNKRAHDAQLSAQARVEVSRQFPWYNDPDSEQRKGMDNIVALFPELKRSPLWELYTAHAVDSMTRVKVKSGNGKPAAKPAAKPPRVAPSGGAAARRVDPTAKALDEAQAAYEKSGRATDYQRVVALRRQAKLAGA